MADCIHHPDLCPDCSGLRVTRMDAGPLSFSGEAKVYIGPVPEPCDNPRQPATETE